MTSAGDSVGISMNNGAVQPGAPVKLRFIVDVSIAEKAIAKGGAPVVFSRSATGATELLAGTYDAAEHSITATTPHFSWFYRSWLDPSQFFSGVADNS